MWLAYYSGDCSPGKIVRLTVRGKGQVVLRAKRTSSTASQLLTLSHLESWFFIRIIDWKSTFVWQKRNRCLSA